MAWATEEWVEPSERRRGFVASIVLLVPVALGGLLFMFGLNAIFSGTGGVILTVAGLAVLIAVALGASMIHPYRRTTAVAAGTTVFHISPATWDVGEQVILNTSRCRKKQALAERGRPRVARVVYFFPNRPTQSHARGQSLARRRKQPRHLYELELQHPIDQIYMRGSARATPTDVTVTVRAKHSVDDVWKKKRTPHMDPSL